MEQCVIDYYNEFPYSVNVIEEMNKEYLELEKKYDNLKEKTSKYNPPIIIVKNIEEYKYYDNLLYIEFPKKVKDLLDGEGGILSLIEVIPYDDILTPNLYKRFMNNYFEKKETCKEKIINELDNITRHKNKEWCEDRINLAFELCLSKYGHISNLSNDEIIDDLVHHIMNDENCDYLPSIYIKIISEFYIPEGELYGLYNLVCFRCEICGIIHAHQGENDNKLLCLDCG